MPSAHDRLGSAVAEVTIQIQKRRPLPIASSAVAVAYVRFFFFRISSWSHIYANASTVLICY